MVVGFARLHGYPVGVITSDSRFKGGALDAPASMKLRRHADICELFHVPIINLVDIIDPRATRAMACRWAALAYMKLGHGDQLGPRPGFFRP
mmetsp:Transcript_29378/g.88433  ORF Transcript_29378/g.88433 Transcript_29378/m.88433 type:complete len:92 (+) Transcript_29378:500-775(+)